MMHCKNKFISVLLAIMVAVAWTVPSFADDVGANTDSTSASKAVSEETVPKETEEPVKEEQASKEVNENQSGEAIQQEESSSAENTSEKADAPAVSGGEPSNAQNADTGNEVKAKALTSGHSVYYAVDNSTTLADGTYENCEFNFTGGTGKAKFFCDKVIISGGKAKAVIRTSSKNYEHFFTGTVEGEPNNGDDKNADLYNTKTGAIGQGVYKTTVGSNGAFATIPVSIGSTMYLSGRTTAMSEPHWITYQITVSVDESHYSGEVGIQDGTYKPDSFEFKGGTQKAKFDCSKVIVVNGNATAVFTTTSDNMTHVYMGVAPSNAETPELYNPTTKKKGKDVYTIGNKQVSVPVVLNEVKPFSGRTTAMSEPHWVNYTYKISLTPDSEKISDSTVIPPNPDEGTEPGEQTDPTDPSDPVKPVVPVNPKDKQKLSVGTWKVKATTKRKMFYLHPKDTDPAWVILKVNKNKTMTATIILSGEGYDYVYMGTPKQARSAGKSKWIKAKIVNGYYTFTVPVSALDKKLAITPHSWKYEHDADPSTDPWRPDKWIIFYSKGAKKVKGDSSIVPSKKKINKEKKIEKWHDAKNKGTSKVDNSTSLKDGVYKPDRVSWSGGSGRLAYIHCTKVTVKGGKAFATLEFASSKYDSLRANGTTYSKQGGGNSKFVIPIKLNANNTIIGRTTAMSQPHWIEYKVFVYIAGATGGKDGKDGKLVDSNKLTDKAPELIGLKSVGKTDIEHAKLFRIFKYEQGITLIAIDQSSDTALYKKPKKEAKAEEANVEETIEYDEDGKPIAKSENEFTNELYQNNVVNYLVVPEGVELPAGLEKDCIIIQKPVDSTFAFAEEAEDMISQIGMKDALQNMDEVGDYEKPDFKKIVLEKGDLVVLSSEALPEKVTKKSTDEEVEASKEKTKTLRRLQTRYSSLSVPVMVDRSQNEASNYGDAEWIKVYGAIYGEEETAALAFDKYVKDNKKEKIDDEK